MTRKVFAILLITFFTVAALPLSARAETPPVEGGGSLAPPGGLSVQQRQEDAGIRIALTWNAAEDAFGYNVYRSDSESGPFVSVGGKAADSMREYPVFLDEKVEAGRDYWYKVTCVDADLVEGPASGLVHARLEPVIKAAGGPKSMTCSLADQRIYFFEGNQLINIMRCSTGLSGPTPTGTFHILAHLGTNVGMGGAVCDYWMAFTSSHGMHAWPRGLRGYETGLGAPASHGCVRLHPLEAYWPYNWAPDGTPLTITYSSMARRIITGCHDSVGAPQLSNDWYFAEGYSGDAYDTYLLLANPGDNGVTAKVYFLKDGGGEVEQDCGIAPHSRFTLKVDDVPGMDAVSFATQVHADSPIVAERAMYFATSSRNDGTDTIGATQLSTDWYFAEGCTAMNFDTFILLANPGDQGVTAWVTFLLEAGGTVDYACTIAPRSRFTIRVDELPGVSSAAFASKIHADGPIVAERAMYFNKGYVDGGHVTTGANQLAQNWYFAEGCTRNFFESYILVGNPNDQDALVNIDFYLPDGNIRYTYAIWAHSRLTVPIGLLPGLNNKDVAFTVSADHPVVAERSLYYALDSHKGGSNTMGSTDTSDIWFFAEGYTDGAFDTYILLSNPGPDPADVGVGFNRDDGATFAYYFHLDAQRRLSLHVDDLPGLDRAAFSTVVFSKVPVMAERAMYFVMPVGY
jgi:L,D-transpeptidase catalytic domain